MNLVALMSWYDERPADLERAVTSLQHAGVTTLCALDGAYDRFPHGTRRSPADNRHAIRTAARQAAITAHIQTPKTTWPTEMDKRTALFEMGEQHTDENDWYLIIDADEQIIQAPDDLHHRLNTTVLDVGEVTFSEDKTNGTTARYPIPILFRAIRAIRVEANHYTYRTPDGRNLWGNAHTRRLEPRLTLPIVVQHNTLHRQPDRRARARSYYQSRDRDRVETLSPAINPAPRHIAA